MTTRPRKPGAKHSKVEALRAKAEQERSLLYYIDSNRKTQPQYAPAVMAEREKEIVDRFDAALMALMEQAEKDHTAAGDILAKADNPYAWLTDTEIQRASVLAPFIREDIAAMDGGQLLTAVQTAAGGDKVTRWLVNRYSEGQYRTLDKDLTTAMGMSTKAHYETARAALRDSLIPTDRLKEVAAAKTKQAEAQAIYDAAEWARPSVRAETAARWKLPVEYLP